jgi:hypothetical protein
MHDSLFECEIPKNRYIEKTKRLCALLLMDFLRFYLFSSHSRLQISCQYMKSGKSACMFRISYSFQWCQYRRYIAGVFTRNQTEKQMARKCKVSIIVYFSKFEKFGFITAFLIRFCTAGINACAVWLQAVSPKKLVVYL